MKAKCAALLVGMLLLGATRAGATTYAVSEFAGVANQGVGIGGSITTDGATIIGASDILDWSLIGTAILADGSAAFFELGPGNSDVKLAVNITATANALTLGLPNPNFIIPIPAGQLLFVNTIPGVGDIEFLADTNISGIGFTEFFVTNGSVSGEGNADGLIIADAKVIATAPPVVTPLPAALPLFATGLGALGLLGWRRRRKGAAIAP